MEDQYAGGAALRKPVRWAAAAAVILVLALCPTPAAHAATHVAAQASAHLAGHGWHGRPGDPPPATATPEPGSGELVALGLVAGLAVVVSRRARGRRKSQGAAGR